MSLQKQIIKVTCNDDTCFFVGTYHNHTLEEIIEHRKFWATIPVIDSDCPHTDCNYEVLSN